MAGFEPAISSVTSWHPGPTERHHQFVIQRSLALHVHLVKSVHIWILNKFFWLGLSVDPNRLLFSSLSGQVLIAQDLYTPASLLVRRIRMDLWHFCQGHHSHYTTLHSRVQTKDSRRIKRLRPPALSLLTILSHRLADFVRLHITEA